MPRGGRRGHGGHQKRPTAACFRIPSGRVTRLLVAALLFCLFFSPCNADTALRRPPTARQLAAPSTFARAAPLSQIRTRITNPGISPYNSIVQLSFSTTTGNTTCTGVLVEEDLVLTAASCVYFARGSARGLVKPSWAYNVRVEPPGFRRGRAIQEIGVKALHVPAKFITAVGSVGYTTEAASSDYALLRLAKSVKIQRLGRLGVQAFTGTGIAVGYPRDKSGLWSSTCRITTFPLGQKNTKPNALIPCDLGSGQEGSPVLRFRNTPGVGAASLIGLIIRAPNTGTQNRIAVLNNATEMFIRRVYKGLPKDPCLRSGRTCHPQALCTTDGNRANCTCRPGLFGDGYSCGSDLCLARGLRCSVNGYCWDTGDIPRCRCNVGFVGDGVICVRPTTSRRPVTSSATGKTSSKTSTMTFKTTTLSPTPTNSIPGSCVGCDARSV